MSSVLCKVLAGLSLIVGLCAGPVLEREPERVQRVDVIANLLEKV